MAGEVRTRSRRLDDRLARAARRALRRPDQTGPNPDLPSGTAPA
jgi:hypothetical protein